MVFPDSRSEEHKTVSPIDINYAMQLPPVPVHQWSLASEKTTNFELDLE